MGMKLIDVMKLMDPDDYGPIFHPEKKYEKIDDRPLSIFKIELRFMCEEETWITVSLHSAILVPWFGCEVSSIEPVSNDTLACWMSQDDFLINNFIDNLKMLPQDNMYRACYDPREILEEGAEDDTH